MKWAVKVADSELERQVGESLVEARKRAGRTVQLMICSAVFDDLVKIGLSDVEILAALKGIRSRVDAERVLETLERTTVIPGS